MAGEWIKVTLNLHAKPEVFKLSRLLSEPVDLVVGRLVRFWAWADGITVDGVVDGIVDADVDAVVGRVGFCDALVTVGWVSRNPKILGLEITKFSRHNGESAKKRALKSERQARWRGKSVDAGASTREEKSREEVTTVSVSREEATTTPTPTNQTVSRNMNGGARGVAERVLEFLNERAHRDFRPTDVNLDFILARLKEGYTEGQCRQVIAKKIREWGSDDMMAKFIRPATLFNREKFNQYAGELVAATPEGGSA